MRTPERMAPGPAHQEAIYRKLQLVIGANKMTLIPARTEAAREEGRYPAQQ